MPLEEWDRSTAETTTTFTLVKDINVPTPDGNVIIDPEVRLTVPGSAATAGDRITIPTILPTDLTANHLIAATTIIATVVFLGYDRQQRRIAASFAAPQPP